VEYKFLCCIQVLYDLGLTALGEDTFLVGEDTLVFLVCVCLLLQDLLQSCSRGGEEESGGHLDQMRGRA